MKYLKASAMNLTKYFEPSRIWLLLKMELFRSRKGILITVVITFGLLFAGFLLESIFGYNKVFDSHPGSYAFTLLTGGFILSSLAFNDLSNPLKRYNYLTLPASTLEKFISMWFLTCVCWIVMFTIAFIFYSLTANAMGHLLFSNKTYLSFDPLGRVPIDAIKYYIVLQGIFLIGAVHFKGYVLPKTIFTLLLFGMVCGFIFYFSMSDLFHFDGEYISEYSLMKGTPLYQVWLFMQWMFWWVLAPLCWVITYIGLKEQEV
jgi:hypothetical protein